MREFKTKLRDKNEVPIYLGDVLYLHDLKMQVMVVEGNGELVGVDIKTGVCLGELDKITKTICFAYGEKGEL